LLKWGTEDEICSICGEKLYEISNDSGDEKNGTEATEIVSTMMVTGILWQEIPIKLEKTGLGMVDGTV